MENKKEIDLYAWGVFFRVIDAHDGRISLTNIAVIVVLVKLIYAPATSLTDIGALLIALSSYAYKKVINNSNKEEPEDTITPQVEAVKSDLESIKSQVATMAISAGLKNLK